MGRGSEEATDFDAACDDTSKYDILGKGVQNERKLTSSAGSATWRR
jgi:hypothetical protein